MKHFSSCITLVKAGLCNFSEIYIFFYIFVFYFSFQHYCRINSVGVKTRIRHLFNENLWKTHR